MEKFKRIITIVLDSVGIGEAPDAEMFGDEGADTLGHLCAYWENNLAVPNLSQLGLGRINRPEPLVGITSSSQLPSFVGKMQEISAGKDSMDGHWEMMGVAVRTPLNMFPDGFPQLLISKIEKFSNRKVILNRAYSGTQAIYDYGEQQLAEGSLIVYTSGDSVLQIASNEAVVPVDELYRICRFVRITVDSSQWHIGRIIARPFVGQTSTNFQRTSNRRDYSMSPLRKTVLDQLVEHNVNVYGIGKINDIFSCRGISEQIHTMNNDDAVNQILHVMEHTSTGFVFANLVDFDSNYGHRRDPEGYGNELARVDQPLGEVLACLQSSDLLIITADYGNDPTFRGHDHTREYVPLIVYAACLSGGNLGIRPTFSDLGATILENFDIKAETGGQSFLGELK